MGVAFVFEFKVVGIDGWSWILFPVIIRKIQGQRCFGQLRLWIVVIMVTI